jgi:hypothetical protein
MTTLLLTTGHMWDELWRLKDERKKKENVIDDGCIWTGNESTFVFIFFSAVHRIFPSTHRFAFGVSFLIAQCIFI